MDFNFKVPSKTFLVGEYAVLKGGPALVLNTQPLFSFNVTKSSESDCKGIHPLSPAGKWLRSRAVYFKGLKTHFQDPWQERGGFGASSAQFLFVHALTSILQGDFPFIDGERYLEKLLSDFFSLYDGEVGAKPSGVDLVAQFLGGVSLIEKEREKSRLTNWPFEYKNFLLFKTGHKIKSHEHLKNLKSKDLDPIVEQARKCVFLFEKIEWSAFVESIKHYQYLLSKNQWTYDKTTNLLNDIRAWPEVEAVKGCGAQGADTIVLLCDDSVSGSLKVKCEALGLEFVGDKRSLAEGFGFEATNIQLQPPVKIQFSDFNEVLTALNRESEL